MVSVFFVTFFFLIISSFLIFLWRWYRPLNEKKWIQNSYHLFFLALAFMLLVPPILYRQTPPLIDPGNPLLWAHYILLGLASLLFSYGPIFYLAQKILHRKTKDEPVAIERRDFLTKGLKLGSLALAGTQVSATYVGLGPTPEISRIKVPIDKSIWSPELEDFKIAQISDLHIGPLIGSDYVKTVVRAVNDLKPSMVAITGDMIDGTVQQLGQSVELLKGLKSELGTFFVTGNHEYYFNSTAWVKYLKEIGFKVLENENQILDFRGVKIGIAGVPDYRMAVKSDPKSALKGLGQDSLNILLAHQPRSVFKASKEPVHLQLSGHTHAGQYFPFTRVIHWAQPYVKGLNKVEKTWLYINQGTGYWGPPLRSESKMEVSLIEFTS